MVSGIIGNLLQVSVPAKTLWLLQTTCANALMATTKQGVKGLDASFWGVRDVLQASKLQKRKGNVKGDTWLWFEARWCSARDTGTTQTTVTGTGKMTLVTTTKKKKRLVSFFLLGKKKRAQLHCYEANQGTTMLLVFLQSRAFYCPVGESLTTNLRP
jgi:hypothetical protein